MIQKRIFPLLIVVMGVSGSGKTTLATAIAQHFDITFLDADSFHSQAAIQQMSQGIALTDEQRLPWIDRICSQLNQYEKKGHSCVLAYSGLKQKHRQLIFKTYENTFGILLNADVAIIEQRLKARHNHFMSPGLLNSQITAMESFGDQTSVLKLGLNETLENLLLQSVSAIDLHYGEW